MSGDRRLMLIVALAGAAFVLFFPARQLLAQREHTAKLERRLTVLRTESRHLSAEVERLEDEGELEAMARERLGLVRPGEHAYFLEPSETKPPASVATTKDRSFVGRLWDGFVSLVRGRR